MAPTPIIFQFRRQGVDRGFLHRLAGESVWCERPLTADAAATGLPFRPALPLDRNWTPIYDGPGLLAGGVERIRSERGECGAYRITYLDGETFLISADGGTIHRLDDSSREIAMPDIPRLLGAPLALAFALRGVYLLHASGLAAGDGADIAVIALTAESGGGKSTLAAAASRMPELGLTRVADDQLPVRLGPSPAALPSFPQLKLRSEDQYPATAPAMVGFRALVELEVDARCGAPELSRRSLSEALQSLVRATVAAKLFDRELLIRHFDACASTALSLPVCRLRYPRDLARLGEALAVLSQLPQ